MEQDDEARITAVKLISRGLITPGEAARLAGVSRQLVNYWIRRKGVQWQDRYYDRIGKVWRKELMRHR
jgi:predicted HTH domain antitoxin